jgi:hypothetical protein
MRSIALLIILFVPVVSYGQMKMKWYFSPDTMFAARVTTVQEKGGGNAESRIEIGTTKGKRLAVDDFISKDREHGLGVLTAKWTYDSQFFVFSTMASGGRQPGHFPTYFYSRRGNRFYSLDRLIKTRIIDPEFYIDPPDVILITGRDVLKHGVLGDTLQRAAHLGNLIKPPPK